MYLNTNKGIYNSVWLLNTIFTINCSSVWCFIRKNFWHFEHFVFNLLFSFSFSALQDFLPTIASKHLKHLPDVGLKFRLIAGRYLVDSKNTLNLLITIIFNPFDSLYFLLIAGKTKSFLKSFQNLLVWYRSSYLSTTGFNSLGVPFRSSFMVPTMWGSDPWIYWSLEGCSIQTARWWDIWNIRWFRWCNTLQLDLQLSLVYQHMASYIRCKVLKNDFGTIRHT